MIVEDFISSLVTKFKAKNDDNRNKVFYQDLEVFCNKCPENHLQDVYNWITMNHTYSTPFQMAKIYDYAKDKEYIAPIVQEHRRAPAWWRCSDCGVLYGYLGRGCPKCGGYKRQLFTGESIPQEVIGMTEDCLHCEMFHDGILKFNIKLYGGTCEEYGVKQDPKCKDCKCQRCCKQMMIYNSNPREFLRQKEEGELDDLFLMKAPDIQKTLKALVKKRAI